MVIPACKPPLISEVKLSPISRVSFFEKFGTSDEENSLSLIEEHKSIFEDYFSNYKEESEKRAGMVIKLSFLLSAGITILLI